MHRLAMATYKIIGGDRKEYGPVSSDDLRRWIAEGRLNGRSQIQLEGANEWKALADFPEFANALAAAAGAAPEPGTAPSPANAEAWSNQILAQQPRLQIGSCLRRSFELLRADPGLLLGASTLVWLVGFCQFIPVLQLAYQIMAGALYGGLYLVFLKRIRGQPAAVGEVFDGFKSSLGQLVLAGFISSLLAGLGALFCVLPGIFLSIAWVFCVPLVADRRMEFWSAMESSRKVVTRCWFDVFGLVVVAFMPLILLTVFKNAKISANLFSGFGDVMSTGHMDAERLTRMISQALRTGLEFGLLTRAVLLFNLPIAMGALMYAYEDLFGSRPAPAP